MRRTLPFLLLLAWALPSQAQRFLRPADTLTQMTTVLNPSDPNTNIFVGAVGSWYQWIRGSTDSEDGTNTLASVFPGAPTGRFKKVSLAGGAVVVPPSVTNFTVVVVDNVAQLKSLPTTNGIGLVLLRGYFDPGDEGGGSVYLDTQNALVPDDGTVFSPNNGPYFWARFIPETFTGVKVAWFGPITNSTIDAAQAFATNRGGRNVVITGTNNLVTPPIRLLSNNTLAFETGANLIGNNTSNLIEIVGQSNVAIVGATLIGAVTNIWILNSTNVRIRDSLMVDASGAGIGMAGGTNIFGLELTGNQFSTNIPVKYGNLSSTTIGNLYLEDAERVVVNQRLSVGILSTVAPVNFQPVITNGVARGIYLTPRWPLTNSGVSGLFYGVEGLLDSLNAPTNHFHSAVGLRYQSQVPTTNTHLSGSTGSGLGSAALLGVLSVQNNTNGHGAGVKGMAQGSQPLVIGVNGQGTRLQTATNQIAVGVLGHSIWDSTVLSGTNVGGAFFLSATNNITGTENPVTVALLADNYGTGRDVFIARTNNTEVFKVDESGNVVLRAGAKIFTGTGTPEAAVTAPIGSTFHRTDGGASTTLYIKESGAGNTGWVAAGSGGGGGLADPGGNGVLVRTALNTTVNRTLTGTANQVSVANGDGVAANPTLSTPQDIHTSATPQFARMGLGIAADATRPLSVLMSGLGTTVNAGIILSNATPAAAGAQQISPAIYLQGQGWKTDATAASQPVEYRLHVLPVQGSAAPSANYLIQSSINGGAFSTASTLTSAGALTVPGMLTAANITATGGNAALGNIIVSGNTTVWAPSANVMRFAGSAFGTTFTALQLYGDSSSLQLGASQDTILLRDGAANTFAQRNAANPQTKRIYGTFTDTSNYERVTITTVAGTGAEILTETAGTGGDNLNLKLTPSGTGDVQIGKALVALGGGAAPTVGTIGGSGPATAAQNSWLQLKDSSGAAMWVPVWK